ncbi:MAG: single-stranded DNA-binding protein [Candidatus Gracilibacteria bacterium]|nr:single-stranded DNA-binding protein [Candidatus Gracilibacteria bacterium]
MDLNKSQIIGRLTSDIELRTTPNGQNVTSFSVATNRTWVDGSGMKQEQAEFHNVVLWGKLAEIASQYLQKGRRVFIEGRLQTRAWEAQDGSKRYKTEIIGDNMIMLDSNTSTPSSGDSDYSSENQTPAIKKTAPKKEEEINIEDIPF